MKKQKKSREQRKGRPNEADKILHERLRAQGGLVTHTPPGVRKISDVLLEFSKPLLDVFRREGGATRSDFEDVLQVTSFIWNAALLPDGDQKLREMRQKFASSLPPEITDVIDDLIESRVTVYADDRRLVGDFEVQPGGAPGEMRVSVAYAL